MLVETYRYDASLRLQQEINRASELRYESRSPTRISKRTSADTHDATSGRWLHAPCLTIWDAAARVSVSGRRIRIRIASGDQASSARPRGWIFPSFVVLAPNDRCLLRRYCSCRISARRAPIPCSSATPACITRLDELGWRARCTSQRRIRRSVSRTFLWLIDPRLTARSGQSPHRADV